MRQRTIATGNLLIFEFTTQKNPPAAAATAAKSIVSVAEILKLRELEKKVLMEVVVQHFQKLGFLNKDQDLNPTSFVN